MAAAIGASGTEGSGAGRHAARAGRRTAQSMGVAIAGTALLVTALAVVQESAALPTAQEHRAEQTRTITYWLLEPATHKFRISHDFTVETPGQRHVHSFVRAGSVVEGAEVWDLDAGVQLETYEVTGREVNALGYYPQPTADSTVVVQADLLAPIGEGESVRVRVVETYTDAERYYLEGDELVWHRSLGRPYNTVKLPPGWMLTAVSVPATIAIDGDGLVSLRFINPRNDSLDVLIRARRRP